MATLSAGEAAEAAFVPAIALGRALVLFGGFVALRGVNPLDF